jgi:hypothetical protein
MTIVEIRTRKTISVSLLRTDGGTQTRERIDLDTVDAYASEMSEGAEFPPVVVFCDGETYWLADGFHRVAAAKRCGTVKLAVDIRQGDKRAAILFSVGANVSHGLRRTNADKRRAVRVLLGDREWGKRSDRWIAEKCGVSHTLVQGVRAQLATDASSRTGQDGKIRRTPVRQAATPGNDTGNDDEPVERELVEAEHDGPTVHPERPIDGWGRFDVSTHVVRIVQATRDFADRLDALFREVDPRFGDEVAKRAEDSILTAFERMAAHLPVDAKRAERNRARFQVLTGGK